MIEETKTPDSAPAGVSDSTQLLGCNTGGLGCCAREGRTEPELKALQLELTRVVRSTECSDYYLSHSLLSMEMYRDEIFRKTVYELSAYFYKVDGEPIKIPANWWQHFKQRWYPRWARKRWPARMVTYTPRALFLDETPPDKFTKGRVMYYFEPQSFEIERR